MEKGNAYWIVLTVLALVLGLAVGLLVAPEKVVTEKITVQGETVYKNVTVEVPVKEIVERNYIGEVREILVSEFSEQDDLLLCNGHDYDEEDVSISKIYDEYSVTSGDTDNAELTVDFKVKLRYKEADLESCSRTLDASVFYEEDEDPVLTY